MSNSHKENFQTRTSDSHTKLQNDNFQPASDVCHSDGTLASQESDLQKPTDTRHSVGVPASDICHSDGTITSHGKELQRPTGTQHSVEIPASKSYHPDTHLGSQEERPQTHSDIQRSIERSRKKHRRVQTTYLRAPEGFLRLGIPGDGNCGMTAISTAVLLEARSNADRFRLEWYAMFGSSKDPHDERSGDEIDATALLLTQYTQSRHDSRILYQNRPFMRLQTRFRRRILERMDLMATRREWKRHLLNQEWRDLLRRPGQYISRSCLYAAGSVLQRNISCRDNNTGRWTHYMWTTPDTTTADDFLSQHVLLEFVNGNHFNSFLRVRNRDAVEARHSVESIQSDLDQGPSDTRHSVESARSSLRDTPVATRYSAGSVQDASQRPSAYERTVEAVLQTCGGHDSASIRHSVIPPQSHSGSVSVDVRERSMSRWRHQAFVMLTSRVFFDTVSLRQD